MRPLLSQLGFGEVAYEQLLRVSRLRPLLPPLRFTCYVSGSLWPKVSVTSNPACTDYLAARTLIKSLQVLVMVFRTSARNG